MTPLDVFGVHGVGGILGAILTGVFPPVLGGAGIWDYVGNKVADGYWPTRSSSGYRRRHHCRVVRRRRLHRLVDMFIGLRRRRRARRSSAKPRTAAFLRCSAQGRPVGGPRGRQPVVPPVFIDGRGRLSNAPGMDSTNSSRSAGFFIGGGRERPQRKPAGHRRRQGSFARHGPPPPNPAPGQRESPTQDFAGPKPYVIAVHRGADGADLQQRGGGCLRIRRPLVGCNLAVGRGGELEQQDRLLAGAGLRLGTVQPTRFRSLAGTAVRPVVSLAGPPDYRPGRGGVFPCPPTGVIPPLGASDRPVGRRACMPLPSFNPPTTRPACRQVAP